MTSLRLCGLDLPFGRLVGAPGAEAVQYVTVKTDRTNDTRARRILFPMLLPTTSPPLPTILDSQNRISHWRRMSDSNSVRPPPTADPPSNLHDFILTFGAERQPCTHPRQSAPVASQTERVSAGAGGEVSELRAARRRGVGGDPGGCPPSLRREQETARAAPAEGRIRRRDRCLLDSRARKPARTAPGVVAGVEAAEQNAVQR